MSKWFTFKMHEDTPRIDPSTVVRIWTGENHSGSYPYSIYYTILSENHWHTYETKEARDKDYNRLTEVLKRKERNMIESAKEYLRKHQDTILTIVVVVVLDYLFFGGAFRDKAKSLVEGVLNKAEKKLGEGDGSKK